MRPDQVSQTEIDVGLFQERDVRQIRALLPPVVKLFGAIVGRNEGVKVNE